MWTQQEIFIMRQTTDHKSREGTPHPCVAWVNGPLAINRKLVERGTGFAFHPREWNITHLRSGETLFRARRLGKPQAMRIVEALLPLVDWSLRKPDLFAAVESKGLLPRIKEVFRNA